MIDFKQTDLKISTRSILLVTIPLTLNLVILAALGYLVNRQQSETVSEIQQRRLSEIVGRIGASFFKCGVLGIRYTMTGSESTGREYEQVVKNLDQSVDEVRAMTPADSPEHRTVEQMRVIYSRAFRVYSAVKKSIEEGRDGMTFLSEEQTSYELNALLTLCAHHHSKLIQLVHANQELHKSNRENLLLTSKILIFAAIAANIALSIYLAVYFGRTIADRLQVLLDNITRLERSEPLPAVIPGRDELARLDDVYHKMAEMLNETHKRERALLDSAGDIIAIVDDQRVFQSVSPSVQQLWGYSPAELIGKKVDDFVEPEEVEEAVKGLAPSADNESASDFEVNVMQKSGALVHMLWSAHWSGDERKFFCVARDITGRKAAEDFLRDSETRIRTIIESLPICLLTVDERGFIEAANHRAQQLLGVHSEVGDGGAKSEATDSSGFQIPVQSPPLVGQHFSKLFTSIKASESEFVSMLNESFFDRIADATCNTISGAPLPVEISVNRFMFQGRPKWLAILVDQTERIQIEKARQNLVNMVSHDLRGPLTGVMAIMDMLISGMLGDLSRNDSRDVQTANRELERLLMMVNGLLDLEKIKAGMLTLHKEVTYLQPLVANAIAIVAGPLSELNVTIEQQVEDCELFCDANRIVQVMVYLLTDSIKRGGPNCAIKIVACETADELIHFQLVSASPPADATGRSHRSELGLLVCEGILRAHRGSLEYNDDLTRSNMFSRFTLMVPEDD
jgi:PAS domain S-box-containing protein